MCLNCWQQLLSVIETINTNRIKSTHLLLHIRLFEQNWLLPQTLLILVLGNDTGCIGITSYYLLIKHYVEWDILSIVIKDYDVPYDLIFITLIGFSVFLLGIGMDYLRLSLEIINLAWNRLHFIIIFIKNVNKLINYKKRIKIKKYLKNHCTFDLHRNIDYNN